MAETLRVGAETLTKHTITVEELRVGDWKQTGRDFISRVTAIEPYQTTVNGKDWFTDHRYLVVNGIHPPRPLDEVVEVWR